MKTLAIFATAALLVAATGGPAAVAQEEGGAQADWNKLLAEKAESVVSVKFVLSLRIMGQQQESNREVRGVIVNEGGLILSSNSNFDLGLSPRMRRMLEAQGQSVSASPSDIKVLFGNEETEYPAQLVARDTNLGLAFLQILDLKDRKVKPVDLSGEDTLAVGQQLCSVTRLPRGFDNAPMLGRVFVSGRIEKPRKMWSVSASSVTVGNPVFDLSGKTVGVLAVQSGSEGVDGGGGGGLGALLGAAQGQQLVVLPLSTVRSRLKQAEKLAVERLAEAKEDAEKEAAEKESEENEAEEKEEGGGDK